MRIRQENILGELGSAIGKGLIAGIAGTASITISQMIEMKITQRQSSEAPIKVASQVTNIQPVNEESKSKVTQEIHWAYGTVWGVARGLISLTGLKGIPATLLHFGMVWGAALVMLPSFEAGPAPQEEDAKTLAVDALHHAVYATATGLAFDALDMGSGNERKLRRVLKHLNLKDLVDKIKP